MDPYRIEQCLAGLAQAPPGSPEFDALTATLLRRGAPAETVHSRFAERTADPLRDRALPDARAAAAGLAAAVARLRQLFAELDPGRGGFGLRLGRRRSWPDRVLARSDRLRDGLTELRTARDELLRQRVGLRREQELAAAHRERLAVELTGLRQIIVRVRELAGRADPGRAAALRAGPSDQLASAEADLLSRITALDHHVLSVDAVLRTGEELLSAVQRADTLAAQALDTAVTAARVAGAAEALPELVARAVAALDAAAYASGASGASGAR